MKYIGSVLGPAVARAHHWRAHSFPESGGVSPLPEVGHCDRSLNYSAVVHALKPSPVLRWSDVRRAECLRLLCGLSRAAPIDLGKPDPEDDDQDDFDEGDDDALSDLDDDDDFDDHPSDEELYDALTALRQPPPQARMEGLPATAGAPLRSGSVAFGDPGTVTPGSE